VARRAETCVRFTSDSAQTPSKTRGSQRAARKTGQQLSQPYEICKTSIPGSNPGGASNSPVRIPLRKFACPVVCSPRRASARDLRRGGGSENLPFEPHAVAADPAMVSKRPTTGGEPQVLERLISDRGSATRWRHQTRTSIAVTRSGPSAGATPGAPVVRHRSLEALPSSSPQGASRPGTRPSQRTARR
jgi:hypothetical protein